MYRRYAVKFNKQQVEFINCVNMVERIKKARALHDGIAHMGVRGFIVASSGFGNNKCVKIKNCK